MDDLIVIILTLIVAGIGALGQLKKKKQTQTGSEANGNTPDSFWDLIKGESGITQQEEYSEFEDSDFDRETVSTVREEAPKQSSVYSFDGKKEGETEILDEPVEQTKRSKIKSGVLHDFSLRKAVIYSEILNRKYT